MKKSLLVFSIILMSVLAYSQSSKNHKKDKNKGNNDNSEIMFVSDSTEVFTIVEDMPTFPGGDKARNRFLAENIIYPEKATRYGIQGTVYISFIVNREGSVTDVKLLRGIGSGCDEEAVRVVKLLPKWNPGKQGGKTVNVLFNMPIYFKLSGKK